MSGQLLRPTFTDLTGEIKKLRIGCPDSDHFRGSIRLTICAVGGRHIECEIASNAFEFRTNQFVQLLEAPPDAVGEQEKFPNWKNEIHAVTNLQSGLINQHFQ